jgi:hypothetical protein
VEDLSGADVTAFLLRGCAWLAVRSAQHLVNDLRSLLRFLFLEGLTPMALASSTGTQAPVPANSQEHDRKLPDGPVRAFLEHRVGDQPGVKETWRHGGLARAISEMSGLR